MNGDLMNLRAGAVDRRVATKLLLKCKGSCTPNAYAFHFVVNSSEKKDSFPLHLYLVSSSSIAI